MPAGFLFSSLAAGIEKPGVLDLGLICSTLPASAAGVFTKNRFLAAPVKLSRRRAAAGCLRAVLVNSGNANACTGRPGMQAARKTGAALARALGIREREVALCSTGVIGQQLPAQRLIDAIPDLVRAGSAKGLDGFSRAIMTTDTRPKLAWASGRLAGAQVRVVGTAKGAGMIQPQMATMLAFIVTDAAVCPQVLRRVTQRVADQSFNRVSVDGDTSTNDTLLVLANGAAGGSKLEAADGAAVEALERLLLEVARPLALDMARDGEGATKLIHVVVRGARSVRDAEKAAREVANSPLVKTAFFGEDANWGRIVMALGNSGARLVPERVRLAFDDVVLVESGLYAGLEAEQAAAEVLKQDELSVIVDLAVGDGEFTMHTCDFSYDYVRINADYRS